MLVIYLGLIYLDPQALLGVDNSAMGPHAPSALSPALCIPPCTVTCGATTMCMPATTSAYPRGSAEDSPARRRWLRLQSGVEGPSVEICEGEGCVGEVHFSASTCDRCPVINGVRSFLRGAWRHQGAGGCYGPVTRWGSTPRVGDPCRFAISHGCNLRSARRGAGGRRSRPEPESPSSPSRPGRTGRG